MPESELSIAALDAGTGALEQIDAVLDDLVDPRPFGRGQDRLGGDAQELGSLLDCEFRSIVIARIGAS